MRYNFTAVATSELIKSLEEINRLLLVPTDSIWSSADTYEWHLAQETVVRQRRAAIRQELDKRGVETTLVQGT